MCRVEVFPVFILKIFPARILQKLWVMKFILTGDWNEYQLTSHDSEPNQQHH